jgi:uncharacterized protein YaaN involved in tellurite resistance
MPSIGATSAVEGIKRTAAKMHPKIARAIRLTIPLLLVEKSFVAFLIVKSLFQMPF